MTPLFPPGGERRTGKLLMTRAVPTTDAPVVCLAAGVLGLNATSDILDPAGPPLAARGSPRLPPGPLESYLSPNTVWIAWYILESLLYLVDIRNF